MWEAFGARVCGIGQSLTSLLVFSHLSLCDPECASRLGGAKSPSPRGAVGREVSSEVESGEHTERCTKQDEHQKHVNTRIPNQNCAEHVPQSEKKPGMVKVTRSTVLFPPHPLTHSLKLLLES